MQIDHAIILGAGLGTRMGEVGKELPKPLWPVFEKTLLELQLELFKDINIKNWHINTHHQSERIENFINKNELPLTIHYEPTLLKSGGTLHALRKKLGSRGYLLVINSDQLLLCDYQKELQSMFEMIENGPTLLCMNVDKSSGLNETRIKENKLREIIKGDSGDNYYTYSGISLFKLDQIKENEGVCSFFETVANYQSKDIYCHCLNEYSFYDYGTLNKYTNILYQTFADQKLMNFLIEKEVILSQKMDFNKKSYHSSGESVLNFTNSFLETSFKRSIVLDDSLGPRDDSIVGLGMVDKINLAP